MGLYPLTLGRVWHSYYGNGMIQKDYLLYSDGLFILIEIVERDNFHTPMLTHTPFHFLKGSFTLLYPTLFECKCSDTTGYYPTIDTCGEPELHAILFSFKNFDWLLLIVDRGAGSVGYGLRNLLFNRLWNPLSISILIQRPDQFSASFNQIELTVCVR